MSEHIVSVKFDGTTENHIASLIPSYETLCGLVGDCEGQAIKTVREANVDCTDCIAIWDQCCNFSKIRDENILVTVDTPKAKLGQKTSGIIGRSGWLLPNGKFYTCDNMQHDALAESLGKVVADIEDKWIRVAHPMDTGIPIRISGGAFHLGTRSRPPTKKQVNFMWDWCQHHLMPYPQDELEALEIS